MLVVFALKLLTILAFSWLLPAVMRGGLALRHGGAFRGLMSLTVVSLCAWVFWLAARLLIASILSYAGAFILGLLGCLIGLWLAKKIGSDALFVASSKSLFTAAVVINLVALLIG